MSDKWKKFSEEQAQEEASDALTEAEASELRLDFPDRQQLEEQMTALEQKVADLNDKNLRLLAQLKNTQERAERDVTNAHKYGSEKLITDLLPVIDSLTRGLASTAEGDAASESLRQGMKLTLDLLESTLRKHGVAMIAPAAGDRFNPDQHEAMSMQAGSGQEPNTVIQTIQTGYSLNGRVLRAAMVVVSAPN